MAFGEGVPACRLAFAPTAFTVLGVPGGCVAGPVTLTATGASAPRSGLDHYASTVNGEGAVQGANVQRAGHGTSR